jgi:fructose-1,6-bisphosphatase/inositol monophosphatase family enzyme
MDPTLKSAIFEILGECFRFIQPPLVNYSLLAENLSKQVQVKDGGNIQYNFDVELDRIIIAGLAKHQISGAIFSEESGFFETPGQKYRVVYDPFCNSSLASRTFHEAAIGISFFSYDYQFITSAVLDLQTGLMALVEHGKAAFYQIQTRAAVELDRPMVAQLGDAWLVITLENTDERAHLAEATEILTRSKRIISSSGHIYWLRLAAGFVDAYLDPFGGEHLYEMFACTVAQASGCVVTDRQGTVFDPVLALKTFESNKDFVYYPVAARSARLHAEILANLS